MQEIKKILDSTGDNPDFFQFYHVEKMLLWSKNDYFNPEEIAKIVTKHLLDVDKSFVTQSKMLSIICRDMDSGLGPGMNDKVWGEALLNQILESCELDDSDYWNLALIASEDFQLNNKPKGREIANKLFESSVDQDVLNKLAEIAKDSQFLDDKDLADKISEKVNNM